MTPCGTLWGTPNQPFTKIICSVAALNDMELELPEWSYSNRSDAYKSKFPYGKIPAFEGLDGFTLIEGATIARYVSGLGKKVNLLGSNAKEVALVDQWVHFAEQEIGGPASNIMGVIYGFQGPFNHETLGKHLERMTRGLDYAESYLAARPSGYLVTDSITLADFFLAAMFYGCSYAALGETERAKYPAISNHYKKVTEDEKVKEYWGTENFVQVAVREAKSLPGA